MRTLLSIFLVGFLVLESKCNIDSLILYSPQDAQNVLAQNYQETETRDSISIANNLIKQAKIELIGGNFPHALRLLFKSKNFCKNDKEIIGEITYNEAQIYLANEQLDKASKALSSLQKLSALPVILKAKIWMLQGQLALHQSEFKQAQNFLLKSLLIFQRKQDWASEVQALLHLSNSYLQQGRRVIALHGFRKSLRLSEQNNAMVFQAEIFQRMAEFMHFVGQNDSSQIYIQKALAVATKTKALYRLHKIYFSLYTFAIDNNNTDLALNYYQQYKISGDDLFNANRSREMGSLENMYEIEQQKAQNALLKEKDELQQKEIEQRKFTTWIFAICTIIFLLAVIITSVFSFKIRKANKRLKQFAKVLKQKRDRLKLATSNLKLANSRLIKAQKIIIKQKDAVVEASKAKDLFLSTVSHELRSPLNAILGLTNELIEGELEPRKKESLEVIQFSGNNLLALVNDILDFNKIEAGMIEFEKINFNIKSTVGNIFRSLSPKAKENNISLVLNYDDKLPQWQIGDPVRIGQVLNNLLSNAIKFTQNAQVELVVKLKKTDRNKNSIYFEVIDEGIGIPEDKLDSIFERFTQASADTTRKYGGTGLGLAITKKLVDLMGGEICVDSQLGVGSRFYFTICLDSGVQPELEEKLVEVELPKGLNILLADDNSTNRILAKTVLKNQPIKLTVVEDGQLAFDLLQNDHDFNMLLTDIHMPKMDGLALTKTLRNQGFQFPILALTGSLANTTEKWQELGFNGYLHKPYTKRELLELIHQNLTKNQFI